MRYRLNRGGDRQLNKALTTVVTVRMGRDATTRDYVARRTTVGRTEWESTRSLKRYVTRELYRIMEGTILENGA